MYELNGMESQGARAPERALSSAFGYGRTRRGKTASAGGHRLDAAGHYAQMRELAPLGPDVLDVGGCSLFIGAGLKREMGSRYAGVVAMIAAVVGAEPGRLAVCPTVVEPKFPAYAWRLVSGDGVELAADHG